MQHRTLRLSNPHPDAVAVSSPQARHYTHRKIAAVQRFSAVHEWFISIFQQLNAMILDKTRENLCPSIDYCFSTLPIYQFLRFRR
jgi:hypothetical protein